MSASHRRQTLSARLLWIAGVALGVLVGSLVGQQLARHNMELSAGSPGVEG